MVISVIKGLLYSSRAKGLTTLLLAGAFCLNATIYLNPTVLNAEPKNTAKATRHAVGLLHTPPKAEVLPYPGQNQTLTLRLTNTRETERKLIVALIKDGRFMQVDAKNAYLNEVDLPTYDVVVPAPIAEMSYQFLLFAPDGSVQSSPRYYLRRSCVPEIDTADTKIGPEIQGYQRLEKQVHTAEHLKNDVAGYEKVMGVVEELQRKVSK